MKYIKTWIKNRVEFVIVFVRKIRQCLGDFRVISLSHKVHKEETVKQRGLEKMEPNCSDLING
jgi:hypothetical protein